MKSALKFSQLPRRAFSKGSPDALTWRRRSGNETRREGGRIMSKSVNLLIL